MSVYVNDNVNENVNVNVNECVCKWESVSKYRLRLLRSLSQCKVKLKKDTEFVKVVQTM